MAENGGGGFVSNIQSIFNNGLSKLVDAEISTKYQLNPSNAQYEAPPGAPARKAGQINAILTGVPLWVWIAGGITAAVALILAFKK